LAEREEKERVLSSERAHKQVLTVKKNMHLILNSGTGTLVTVAISTAPNGGFHRESMCSHWSCQKDFNMNVSKQIAILGVSRPVLIMSLILSPSLKSWLTEKKKETWMNRE